jgi:hypothetical protein
MLVAALLASLWAQAEQAPAPTPASGPSAPAPTTSAPAPAASAPALAPPTPPPVVAEPEPPPTKNGVSVLVRYAYRVGTESDITAPAAGLSVGGEFEHRYRAFESGLELGAAVDFFYDRFSKEIIVAGSDPNQPLIRDRTLSQTSFTLSQTVGWRTGDTRLFGAVGAGVTFGYFTSPDLFDGSRTGAQPLVRGMLGMDFAVAKNTFAVLRVDYNHTFQHQTFATGGTVYPLFGDIFDAGAGLLLRF